MSDMPKTVGVAVVGVMVAALLPVGLPVVFAFVLVTGLSTMAAFGFQVLDDQYKLTEKLNVFAHGMNEPISGRIYRFFHSLDENVKAYCYEDMIQLTSEANSY